MFTDEVFPPDREFTDRYTKITEEYGVTYQYQWHLKGPKMVFSSVSDFERYFTAKDGEVPFLHRNWREAPQGGWTVADDGGVVQVIKKNEYKKKNGFYLRTVVGTFNCTYKKAEKWKMDTDFSKRDYPGGRYTFDGRSSRVKDRMAIRKPTKQDKIFALFVGLGFSPEKAYDTAFKGTIYNDPLYVKENIEALMSSDKIKLEISKTVRKISSEHGVDDGWIIDRMKEIAMAGEDERAQLAALKELASLTGMYVRGKTEATGALNPQQRQLTGFNNDSLRALEEAKEEAEDVGGNLGSDNGRDS